jgi:SAM-dependent methyltransferase
VSLILWIVLPIVLLFGFVVFRGAPYVPSKRGDLKRALSELYPVGKNDTLVDIGSGDGLVLREAARRGARAVGYELNPVLVVVSRWLSRGNPAVTVYLADFWRAPLPQSTTVVYTFGDSRDIVRMANKVAETAAQAGRPLMFISYGVAVPGLVPVKQVGPHYLYRIEPLQPEEA